ncbi:MAG: diguanylate cyclase [Phycisphaerales bacterium]|nr:MAG: diguanylate cyclase [Phycisphaerales bacterium]
MDDIIGHTTEIIAITQGETVEAAASKMMTHKVSSLIVNDGNGRLVGLVTERDISNRVAISSEDLQKVTVGEIMTARVVSCPLGTSTSRAREIMATHRIRHLPIVEGGVVVGILSARDLIGQQRLEDRAAAEEVAMLSNCLKSIDIYEAANIVTREVPRLFHADHCVLCLYSDSSATGTAELLSHNSCRCPEEHLERPADTGPSDKSGFYYNRIPDECQELGAQAPRLVVPLKISGLKEPSSGKKKHLTGYLCMCGLAPAITENRELTSYKAKLTKEILTSHLTNASLYQQARLTSLTDALTGVGSRRLLEDELQAEYARAKRYKHPFSVGLIDLDHFKTINDVMGHATGDDALKQLVTCLRGHKRASDVLARYGGDEFVILMPETKAEDAFKSLERARSLVRGIKLGEELPVTISCGIAQSLPDDDDSPSEVMRRADLALYEAKTAGRNCIKIWNGGMSKRLDANDIEIDKVKRLQRRIAGMSEQAEKMFMQSIWGLVQALEAKDEFASAHSENVVLYAVGIAEEMNIGPGQIDVIRRAAMIHDIGKIGVPDAILSKPGLLSPRERSVVEEHPIIAVRILSKMSFLERETAIIRHHHERWNGRGYPDGLSGHSIPLGARIIAVADTLDALTSNRPYRSSLALSEAMNILTDSSAYEFDPEVIKSMVSWAQKVSNELGKRPDQLTPDDLLDSQRKPDDGSPDATHADALAGSPKV